MANVTTNDVKKYLDEKYVAVDEGKYLKTFSNLSSNHKITSTLNAYAFDAIKDTINSRAKSCDALYLKKHLNFIEFKTGFGSVVGENAQIKKESMANAIALKASHSLQLFENSILPAIGDGILSPKTQKIFCAIIDSQQTEISEDVSVDILLDASNISSGISWKKRVIDNVMVVYRSETTLHKKFMYDEAFAMYDFEFDANVSKLR